MRIHLAVAILASAALCATAAAQDCRSSPGGVYSFTTSIAAGAGRRALYDLRIFAGGACSGEPAFAAQVGSVRRLALTDGGVLVSILAPRVRERSWSILELAAFREGERRVRIALEDLPVTAELRGTLRVSFDGASVRFASRDGEVRVPFSELDAVALR